MRIGIDIRAIQGNRSGVGYFACNLVRSLCTIDRENQYLLYANKDISLPFELPDNFSKRILPMPISNLWLQTLCPLDLARMKVDVFHGTNFIVPLVSSVPRVTTVYDLSSFLFPQYHRPINNAIQRLLPASVRASAAVIAVSEHTKNDLISMWNTKSDKISVIPGAAGKEFVPIKDQDKLEKFRREKGLPERFLLFVGTLEPRKNISTIIEALFLMGQNGHGDWKLVVVGEKGWRYGPIFDRLQALGMEEKVVFTGYQGWDVLPYYYNLARLLVFPSLYEGFGLPPLESMACGTPAIVGDNSSLREVVTDPNLRVDAKNPRQLAETISRLLSDSDEYDKVASRGLDDSSAFSWEHFAGQTLEVYRKVAKRR